MAVRVVLAVDAEFLRMVLRRLLRRMAGVKLLGDGTSLVAAAGLQPANAFVVSSSLAAADAPGLAALCARHKGRVALLCRDDSPIPPGAIRLQVGATPDPAVLATRLRAMVASWAIEPGRAARAEPPVEPSPAIRIRRPELIVVAASTGGPEALKQLFAELHPPPCPVVIALHIPAEHCEGLVRHLAAATGHAITVGQAEPLPERGTILLPGGMDHGIFERGGVPWLRRVHGTASVFHPNADVLLASAAALGRHAVAVVLTGMGDDGRAGATAFNARGYPVLVRSPASCAVPGMPGACIVAGVADLVAPRPTVRRRRPAYDALRTAWP